MPIFPHLFARTSTTTLCDNVLSKLMKLTNVQRVTVFIWPSSLGMHTVGVLAVQLPSLSLADIRLMSVFFLWMLLLWQSSHINVAFSPFCCCCSFPSAIILSMAVRLHSHVVLTCWIGCWPPIFHHKLHRLLFYQLNVSNKINLCAFKYAKCKFHFYEPMTM